MKKQQMNICEALREVKEADLLKTMPKNSSTSELIKATNDVYRCFGNGEKTVKWQNELIFSFRESNSIMQPLIDLGFEFEVGGYDMAYIKRYNKRYNLFLSKRFFTEFWKAELTSYKLIALNNIEITNNISLETVIKLDKELSKKKATHQVLQIIKQYHQL